MTARPSPAPAPAPRRLTDWLTSWTSITKASRRCLRKRLMMSESRESVCTRKYMCIMLHICMYAHTHMYMHMYGYIKFMRDHHTISYTAHISSMYWTVQEFFPMSSHHKYKKNSFSFSGEAKDSGIFSFYFLLHKRAKPYTPPLPSPSPARANSNPLLPPYPLSLHTHPPIP